MSGSSVRPKVAKSVHYCPSTKKTLERNYTDLTSYNATLSRYCSNSIDN